MSRNRLTTRSILLLCLLTFQWQAAASLWLDCRHQAAETAMTGCPVHGDVSTSTSDSGRPRLFDCVKCTLAFTLGATQGLPPVEPVQGDFAPAVRYSTPPRHYYHFFPETELRPPAHCLV